MTDASAGSGRAWSPFDEWLADDPEVMELLDAEVDRQSTTLQLIASENFTSPAVLAVSGSVLTNKYAEGYPGRRYYGGNGRRPCSGRSTPTCSLTPGRRRTWRCTRHCSSRGTPSWP